MLKDKIIVLFGPYQIYCDMFKDKIIVLFGPYQIYCDMFKDKIIVLFGPYQIYCDMFKDKIIVLFGPCRYSWNLLCVLVFCIKCREYMVGAEMDKVFPVKLRKLRG